MEAPVILTHGLTSLTSSLDSTPPNPHHPSRNLTNLGCWRAPLDPFSIRSELRSSSSSSWRSSPFHSIHCHLSTTWIELFFHPPYTQLFPSYHTFRLLSPRTLFYFLTLNSGQFRTYLVQARHSCPRRRAGAVPLYLNDDIIALCFLPSRSRLFSPSPVSVLLTLDYCLLDLQIAHRPIATRRPALKRRILTELQQVSERA